MDVTITGLDKVLQALEKTRENLIEAAAKPAALETIGIVKPYPSQSHKKQPFVSAKQRGYFFAALKSGAITVPYRRTFALQDAWEWAATPAGADVINAHPHADGVIGGPGRPRKWTYHIGNWPTETQLAKRAEQPARDAAEMGIIRLLAKADF